MFDDCFEDGLGTEGVSENSRNDTEALCSIVFVVASKEIMCVN